MTGLFKGKKHESERDQRREILKRGLIGIAVVLILAFAVSFFGGSNEKADPSDTKATPDHSDEISLDTSALLNDQPASNSQSLPPQIPASRKFDYRGPDNADNNDGDALITAPADAPIIPNGDAQASPSGLNPVTENGGDPDFGSETSQGPFNAQSGPQGSADQMNDSSASMPGNATKPQNAENTASADPVQKSSGQAFLYCGTFSSAAKAEEQKALMAFQGLSSQVKKHGASFVLKLGPYKDRDAARQTFSKLDANGLVSECSLESN